MIRNTKLPLIYCYNITTLLRKILLEIDPHPASPRQSTCQAALGVSDARTDGGPHLALGPQEERRSPHGTHCSPPRAHRSHALGLVCHILLSTAEQQADMRRSDHRDAVMTELLPGRVPVRG